MKIEKKIVSYESQNVEFLGLTLLSEKEHIKLESNIPKVGFKWWLRSPGNYQRNAAVVLSDGSRYYDCVSSARGVRPALIIDRASFNLKFGDNFFFYGHNWTVISKDYALCDEKFCYMPFRSDFYTHDANNYDTSNIKRYLDREFEKMKE